MDAGCLSVLRSEDGLVERYRIKSTAYKGRASTGVTEEWVAIEPVAKAIAVLEHLTATCDVSVAAILFGEFCINAQTAKNISRLRLYAA